LYPAAGPPVARPESVPEAPPELRVRVWRTPSRHTPPMH
jgi:hypothetical protein